MTAREPRGAEEVEPGLTRAEVGASTTNPHAARERMNYLSVSQSVTLRDWAQAAVRTFPDAGPIYQVGSSLRRLDWRDVDVRLLLDDDRYDALASAVHIRRLDHAISLWGQQVTGLPIDFQVQRMTDANEEYPTWRNPLMWIDCSEEAR